MIVNLSRGKQPELNVSFHPDKLKFKNSVELVDMSVKKKTNILEHVSRAEQPALRS